MNSDKSTTEQQPDQPLPEWLTVCNDDTEYEIIRTVSFDYLGYTANFSVSRSMNEYDYAGISYPTQFFHDADYARRYAAALIAAARIADEINAVAASASNDGGVRE